MHRTPCVHGEPGCLGHDMLAPQGHVTQLEALWPEHGSCHAWIDAKWLITTHLLPRRP